MGGFLEYDQLYRLREAAEQTARQMNNNVPLRVYNDLMSRYEDRIRRHNATIAALDVMVKNRDEFEKWGAGLDRSLAQANQTLEAERATSAKLRDDLSAAQGEVRKLKAANQKLQGDYQRLFVAGKADRDAWKERALAAEQALAALNGSQEGEAK